MMEALNELFSDDSNIIRKFIMLAGILAANVFNECTLQ